MCRRVIKTIGASALFWVLSISSIALIIASFLVPPMGEIHPSVLKALGLLLLFGILPIINNAIVMGKAVALSLDLDDKKVTIETKDKGDTQ